MLHSSCLMHPYYLFQFTPDRILLDRALGCPSFMMTCVLTVGTVRVPMMVHGWVSACRGRELVPWSFIGGPCQVGRATSQLR